MSNLITIDNQDNHVLFEKMTGVRNDPRLDYILAQSISNHTPDITRYIAKMQECCLAASLNTLYTRNINPELIKNNLMLIALDVWFNIRRNLALNNDYMSDNLVYEGVYHTNQDNYIKYTRKT